VKRAGSVVVIDSRPGTPAATAGIAKGDTIVSIDGSPAGTMLLSAVRAKFAQPAGTVVTLQLAGKNGATRTVKLTLDDYV